MKKQPKWICDSLCCNACANWNVEHVHEHWLLQQGNSFSKVGMQAMPPYHTIQKAAAVIHFSISIWCLESKLASKSPWCLFSKQCLATLQKWMHFHLSQLLCNQSITAIYICMCQHFMLTQLGLDLCDLQPWQICHSWHKTFSLYHPNS